MTAGKHLATIEWVREGPFTDHRYSRAHTWRFDGGLAVPASSSPHVVPIPFSNPDNIDPEEAFVAALSSCHMLWFLVDRYTDSAEGEMGANAAGKQWVKRVLLRPHVVFGVGSKSPTPSDVEALHHAAHLECFIANSVRTEVETRSTWEIP
jgi:organic hydroperoxide reductase OsmC/OhrA